MSLGLFCARTILHQPPLVGWNSTNWGTIQKRIARLKEIKRMEEDGTFEVLPKKEVALLNKQRARLEKFLGGIEDMPRIPDVMYVVDPHKEQIAVKEAKNWESQL